MYPRSGNPGWKGPQHSDSDSRRVDSAFPRAHVLPNPPTTFEQHRSYLRAGIHTEERVIGNGVATNGASTHAHVRSDSTNQACHLPSISSLLRSDESAEPAPHTPVPTTSDPFAFGGFGQRHSYPSLEQSPHTRIKGIGAQDDPHLRISTTGRMPSFNGGNGGFQSGTASPRSAPAVLPNSAQRTELRLDHDRSQTSSISYDNDRTGWNGSVSNDSPTEDNGVASASKKSRSRTGQSVSTTTSAPRLLGQRDVPGQGLCYVYEDGTFCKTIIDGEPVNPSWGVTKAGKPRKRLAQACLTCREKKIKCEPNTPKCMQCTKSQRMCKGGSMAPHHSENHSANGSITTGSSSPLKKRSSDEQDIAPALAVLAQTRRTSSLDQNQEKEATAQSSRSQARPSGSTSTNAYSEPSSAAPQPDVWCDTVFQSQQPSHESRSDDYSTLDWERDPYEADPGLVDHLLDMYFTHINAATYCMFPRPHFTSWARKAKHKTSDERMLLHTVLAMGSVFSPDAKAKHAGKQFAGLAATAVTKRLGKFSLQLVQARLILCLYNFSRGKLREAWDMCGSALRAMSAMKLNSEYGVRDFPDDAELDYGFDRVTLEECRRRTFWAAFLMDRYNGFCGGTSCIVVIEDIFVRLPCRLELYEQCAPNETSLFDNTLLQYPPSESCGPMACLSLASAIWGEVLSHTTRNTHLPTPRYEGIYEDFYALTNQRLAGWMAFLPSKLQFTQRNLEAAMQDIYAGTFVSLYAVYHAAAMRLNRHARPSALPRHKVERNISHTIFDAENFLQVMAWLAQANRKRDIGRDDFVFSTPFPGYVFLQAVDVLTAGGRLVDLPGRLQAIHASLKTLHELTRFWASAKAQLKTIQGRLDVLAKIVTGEERGAVRGCIGGSGRRLRVWMIVLMM
ncbi:hypothetical protein H2199_006123 [Coniosporium tulheliwenetii]|uniref:Uncharacterized protein n=1 Tax=Coniosporium tulheliwenetii TaxID=3383036 RepID=A0ACC2YY33_9PEZI|nr:hypothetical protein H2199_006123 [Cladosporium sp. JES 115]